MKKILLVAASFLFISVSQAGIIQCPLTVSCNYEDGVCKYDGSYRFVVDTGGIEEKFEGNITANLKTITGSKEPDSSYEFACKYPYGNHSLIRLYTYAKSLEGQNWTYSGFGNKSAICTDASDPRNCGANSIN